MGKGKYSWKMLLGSTLAGVLYGLAGEVLYHVLIKNTPSILTTFIYFTDMFLFLGLVVYLVGKSIYSHAYRAVNRKQWALTFLLIMGLSVLFELLAGICIEIGMNLLGVPPAFMRILTCVLIAFTLLREDLLFRRNKDTGVKYADTL